MSLFSTFGQKVKGLLGSEAFFDRLAQAQAFEHGDPRTAAWIGAGIGNRRDVSPAADPAATGAADPQGSVAWPPPADRATAIHAVATAPFQPPAPPRHHPQWNLASDPHVRPLQFGDEVHGFTFTGPRKAIHRLEKPEPATGHFIGRQTIPGGRIR